MRSRTTAVRRVVATCIVALTLLAACGDDGGPSPDSSSGRGEPKRGGTLKIAGFSEVLSLKPWDLRGSTAGQDRGVLIFDTLLQMQLDGSFAPSVAESAMSTDGLVWTLKLRPNIKFTDGTALDGEAVKYNI